jgi:hypothetical protein
VPEPTSSSQPRPRCRAFSLRVAAQELGLNVPSMWQNRLDFRRIVRIAVCVGRWTRLRPTHSEAGNNNYNKPLGKQSQAKAPIDPKRLSGAMANRRGSDPPQKDETALRLGPERGFKEKDTGEVSEGKYSRAPSEVQEACLGLLRDFAHGVLGAALAQAELAQCHLEADDDHGAAHALGRLVACAVEATLALKEIVTLQAEGAAS